MKTGRRLKYLALWTVVTVVLFSALAEASTVHVVRPGETLYLLARQYGVSVDELADANSVSDPRNLRVGTKLVIPAAPGEGTVYMVSPGDTLYSIALRYGSTIQALRSANGLEGDVLLPGMKLNVPGSGAAQASGALALPWSQVDRLFPRGSTALITDVRTGLSFTVRRRGGWAHADVEPLTAKDTQTLKRIYGGAWSWSRRPIVVQVSSYRIAASMNGMPHGGSSVSDNGFPGHHCIHFLGSTTHGTRKLDPAHQAAVKEAVGK
ncbi:MAG: LysM peptidoglycan-binding domain-containing protein [Bacillota bacterium]